MVACTAFTLPKPIGLLPLEDVTEAAAVISHGRAAKHSGKDYWFFSGRYLIHGKLAETLTGATGYSSQQQFETRTFP